MRSTSVALFVVVSIGLTNGVASAQSLDLPPPSSETPQRELAAPTRSFEILTGTGYTQGLGEVRRGLGLPAVATAGVGLDLGLGFRVTPHWALMITGQYAELAAERSTAVHGFATSIGAQYHFRPLAKLDPWAELGAGYRFLIEDPAIGANQLTQGLTLARARVGLDIRASDHVAVGPVIGADMNAFLWQDVPNVASSRISDPRLSTFLFGGLQARFDFGPTTRTARVRSVGSR